MRIDANSGDKLGDAFATDTRYTSQSRLLRKLKNLNSSRKFTWHVVTQSQSAKSLLTRLVWHIQLYQKMEESIDFIHVSDTKNIPWVI